METARLQLFQQFGVPVSKPLKRFRAEAPDHQLKLGVNERPRTLPNRP